MRLDVDFGGGKDGLATVGYRQFDDLGGDAVARTTTGVVEIGQGAYGADVTIDAAAVGVEWDTGEATPVYAHENFFAGGLLKGPDAVGDGFDLQSTMRLVLAALAGATTRIRATVDAQGNRTAALLGWRLTYAPRYFAPRYRSPGAAERETIPPWLKRRRIAAKRI